MGLFDKLFKKKFVEPQTIEETQAIEKSQSVITSQSIKRGFVSTYKIPIDYDVIDSLKNRYIAFDVETTGLNPNGDRIIEVGAVLFENGEITKSYGTLVNVGVLIPSAATAVNHITNDMIESAPREEDVYSNLVQFLGDALNGQIVMCAHNAKFDMGFLSETLMRLGYDGKINYVDTLAFSRNLVKGLQNYKQDTVAYHFGIINEQVHRASSDAEVCGKILWSLLKVSDEEQERIRKNKEKNKLTDEEKEVCAYIQDVIVKNGGDTKWLGYIKGNNYVTIKYFYSIFRFKISKEKKYIIIPKNAITNLDFDIELCTKNEGGSTYYRVFFDSPFDLEPLNEHIFKSYKECRTSSLNNIKYDQRCEEAAKKGLLMEITLSSLEVESLIQDARKRKNDLGNLKEKISSRPQKAIINREDITIHPINNRVSLNCIRNLHNDDKGFDEGYPYFKQGEELRKSGDIEGAISLFDQARYNGYDAPALFEAYAKAYRKLKDYDNEIDILDEGLSRIPKRVTLFSILEERRTIAIQLLYKQQEEQKKISQKQQKVQEKAKEKKVTAEVPKRPKGRAIVQLSDDMSVIKEYETIAEAVRETGINSKSIRDAAKGVQNHAGGYVWKYVVDNEYEECVTAEDRE